MRHGRKVEIKQKILLIKRRQGINMRGGNGEHGKRSLREGKRNQMSFVKLFSLWCSKGQAMTGLGVSTRESGLCLQGIGKSRIR